MHRTILLLLFVAAFPVLPAVLPSGAARAQTTEMPAPPPSSPMPRPPRDCSPAPPTT